MSRKDDLENAIRDSYKLVREYADILRLSSDPKEQTRARRAIEEQWKLIKGYLSEYIPLCEHLGQAMPQDIVEISTAIQSPFPPLSSPSTEVAFCPGCRRTVRQGARKGARFCPYCGAEIRIVRSEQDIEAVISGTRAEDVAYVVSSVIRQSAQATEKSAQPSPVFCPTCGSDVPSGADFCDNCGAALTGPTDPFSSSLVDVHALLIGVGGYTHLRFASQPATVRDAQAVATVLTDPARCAYPPANVQVLTDEQATAANIRAALKTLAESTNPESIAFVYFSGHGGRALENSVWRAYLCPREADPDALANTAIPGDEFSALLAAIPARKLLAMLDACHAAGSAEFKTADGTVIWKAGWPDVYYEALSQGSGRVVIASSKEDQFSYVRPQRDLSLFTHHLLQALSGKAAVRGDGLIHVLDVFHYVNEAVSRDEPRQVPILKVKDLDLNFPIALALGGKAAGPVTSVTPVVNIREQIVHDPITGAKMLSEYLAARSEWAAKRNEVDLKRADLERIQRDLDLFGPNPGDQAAKNRAVYFLLRVCLELEQPAQ